MRVNDSRYGLALPVLVASFAVQFAAASQVGANCQERLASVPHNGERGLWTFAGDGTYQVLLSEVNYGHGSRGDMKQFWQTFGAVISKAPDRFVVGSHKPGTTLDRGQGKCLPTGYRP